MIKYRLGMFESNSSSTHSMIIGMEDDYKKWENGELLYKRYENQGFYTKEEAIDILKEIPWYKNRDINFDTIDPEELNEWLEDEGFISADWLDNDELEHDYNEFVTPSGEKICMICRYGWDG